MSNQSPRLELEAHGFTTISPIGDRHPILWASVTKVFVCKRDLLTSDEVVVSFEVAKHPGMAQEVSEEWPGFTELLAQMEQSLGIAPSWYGEIMVPAFEPMGRVLYERP